MDEKQSANTSDEIAVFQAYTSLITSEHETLWARHNALLLANSLIIGALAISPAALWENKWAALVMLSAGFVISVVWVGMAVLAWSTIRRYADLAGSFASASFKPVRRDHLQPRAKEDASPRLADDRGFHVHVS